MNHYLWMRPRALRLTCLLRRLGEGINMRSTVLCLVFLVLSDMPDAIQAVTTERTLDKQELLALAESRYSRIRDLSVSFTFNALKAPRVRGYLGNRFEGTIIVKGEKVYIRRKFGADPEIDPTSFLREAAYNGQRSIIYNGATASAGIESKRADETKTNGNAFFDLMLLNSPGDSTHGGYNMSLISVLRSDYSRVRPKTEVISGRRCHVVDIIDPKTNKVRMSIWLDVLRGGIPLKHQIFDRKTGQAIIEHQIQEVVEVLDGIWMAVRGTKKARMTASNSQQRWMFEHLMEVKRREDGSYDLAVNQGVKEDVFDLWKHLPVGTYVADMDVKVSWTVGGEDYETLAESLASVLDGASINIPERPSTQSIHGEQKTGSTSVGESQVSSRTAPAETSNNHSGVWMVCVAVIAGFLVLGLAVGLVRNRKK